MIAKIEISLAKIISISRKFIFGFVILTTSLNLSAEAYKSVVKFSDGDVVSASVLNDLIDRIELSLKEITVDELLGSWTASQYFCASSLNDPTLDATQAGARTCNNTLGLTGGANLEGGLALKRTDTVAISAVSGQDNQFDIAFSTRNMFGNDSSGTIQTAANFNSAKTHRCAFLGDGALFGCVLDPSMKESGRRFSSYFNTQRLSSTRIKLSWGPWRGGGLFNVVILDKDKLPPDAPTSVQTTLSSSAVAVSWTASIGATSYDVHRKATATGTFTSIGTPSAVSYVDAAVTSGGTYWYRIFAKNSDGTSVGSSVVKSIYNPANSTPVISSDSAFTAVENQTAIGSITASDADSDSLTYTISGTEILISSTGVVSFNAAPVYATKSSYTATISVSDGVKTTTQDITVTITEA